MKVTFSHSLPVTGEITSFYFRPDKPVRYTAGQFIELFLPHIRADSRGERRWFTLSSSPTEELLSITTRVPDSGRTSTFKQTLSGLETGASVAMSDPMGDFVLPKDTTIPVVFVAGGIGITPMRSMVKYLLDTGGKRSLQLLYGARNDHDLAFMDLFRSYGLVPDIYLSAENNPLSVEALLSKATAWPAPLIYISGPEQMVERFRDELLAKGLDSSRVVGDYFPGYPGD